MFFIGLGVYMTLKMEGIRVILDEPVIVRSGSGGLVRVNRGLGGSVVLGLGSTGWALFAGIGVYITQV